MSNQKFRAPTKKRMNEGKSMFNVSYISWNGQEKLSKRTQNAQINRNHKLLKLKIYKS